jgi:nitrile hydratase accessory protein
MRNSGSRHWVSRKLQIDKQTMSAIEPTAARRVAQEIPGIPCDAEGPVFREPWEAQAFAMAVALHERGLFTWGEWAQVLGEEIKSAQRAGDPDTGATYYHHWLAALERIVAAKGVADRATLTRYHDAWDRAADRTPHGTPIELRPEDFGEADSGGRSTSR